MDYGIIISVILDYLQVQFFRIILLRFVHIQNK